MSNRIKQIIKNPYFLITVVYVITQFFMLLLSGCWWDDWTFMTHNLGYINAVASQSGRPEWNILIPFCWSLPNNGRFLIFFLYYLDSIFVYHILKESELFTKEESLVLTLLFIVIPANDARILISNFAYTVGLFVFYLTFSLFVRWNKLEKSNRKTVFRILLLLMFFVSFILNSLMAFYYIVIGYLFVLDLRKNNESNWLKKIVHSVKNVILQYPDFCIIPFVYFAYNKIFFPTNGEIFGSYNSITIKSIIKTIIYVPISAFSTVAKVVLNFVSSINWLVMIVLLVFIGIYSYVHRFEANDISYDYKKTLLYFAYGFVVLLLGLFPYVAIRGMNIELNGIQGRDSILIPLGVSLILFSALSLFGNKQRRLMTAIIVLLGAFSFNQIYLEWQKDYYYQLSMENLLNNQIIKNNDTFFLADLNESNISGQRYYSLNKNASNVYNNETRFFIPKVSNLYLLEDEEALNKTIEALDYAYVMRDYKPDDLNLDAVIIYECDLNTFNTIRYKYNEIFNEEEFNNLIKSNGSMSVVEVDDGFTSLLLKKYNDNEISSDEDVIMLLVEYMSGN